MVIRWYIGLSISKCSALHPGAKNLEIPLTINNNVLPAVIEIRDLQIYIDNKLIFDDHIGYIKGKACALARHLLATLRTKKGKSWC